MIEWVCRMFSPNDEFIFVCNKNHLENNDYRRMLQDIVWNYHIVEIYPHDYGPLYSVIQAEPFIGNKNCPIVITYCDFTMKWNYKQFLLKAAQYEGAITVFRNFHPASFGDTYYAYIKSNEDFEMLELREKKSFTNNRVAEFASTGVYYVESFETFRDYALKILHSGQAAGSEYYCSLIYNPMVHDGKKVCLFEVDKFICWGTPQDLREYMFWSEYFLKDSKSVPKIPVYGVAK